MQAIRDFDSITSYLAIWHTYNAAVKAELYSTCLTTVARIYLIRPYSFAEENTRQPDQSSRVVGIVVTNSNHRRVAAKFAQRFQVPVCAHRETLPDA